ncbi:MAG: hypothetical protein Q9160_004247 [Pyrenula sp. 1 TL-2023]
MRLLNTERLSSETFVEESEIRFPSFAILSHTWEDGEVTFQDIQGDLSSIKCKPGFAKIQGACSQAKKDNFSYIWIDTCCIDKSSSAELSEAINSMWRWYQLSDVCYAYLSDVDTAQAPFALSKGLNDQMPYRWFERGWTLQELLAPRNVAFYSSNWSYLGDRTLLLDEISRITGIDTYALKGGDLRELSVARRMAWASHRKTTRIEDVAYCLLGIFDINMPLLYGEGTKAFIRLQEEIMRTCDDQSIFAWSDPDEQDRPSEPYVTKEGRSHEDHSVFAPSPKYFTHSSVVDFQTVSTGRSTMLNTNLGLRLSLLITRESEVVYGEYLAVLNCEVGSIPGVFPCIRLRRISLEGMQFRRVDIHQLFHLARPDIELAIDVNGFNPTEAQDALFDIHSGTVIKSWKPKEIFISQVPRSHMDPVFRFVPHTRDGSEKLVVNEVYPKGIWDERTGVVRPSAVHSAATNLQDKFALQIALRNVQCVIVIGIRPENSYLGRLSLKPWCKLEVFDLPPDGCRHEALKNLCSSADHTSQLIAESTCASLELSCFVAPRRISANRQTFIIGLVKEPDPGLSLSSIQHYAEEATLSLSESARRIDNPDRVPDRSYAWGSVSTSVFDRSRAVPEYVGIINPGKTGYVNCAMQISFMLRPFRTLWQLYPEQLQTVLQSNFELDSNLLNSLKSMFEDLQHQVYSVSPLDMLESFGWDQQNVKEPQDIVDFLEVFLERIQKLPEGKRLYSAFMDLAGSFLRTRDNVEDNLIRTRDYIDRRTSWCKRTYPSTRRDLVRLINGALEDVLRDFYSDPDYEKTQKIPPVFMTKIRTCSYDIDKDEMVWFRGGFTFPAILRMNKVVNIEREAHKCVYALHGVVVLEGAKENARWLVYLKPQEEGQWFKFFNEVVSPASSTEVIEESYTYGGSEDGEAPPRTAYLLMYLQVSKLDMLLGR